MQEGGMKKLKCTVFYCLNVTVHKSVGEKNQFTSVLLTGASLMQKTLAFFLIVFKFKILTASYISDISFVHSMSSPGLRVVQGTLKKSVKFILP